MARVGVSVSNSGADEFRALAKKLRQAGRKDLRTKLRQEIRRAGQPVLNDVKSAVQSLNVKGTGGGGVSARRRFNIERATTARAKSAAERRGAGLRAAVARATKLEQTARGVRFVTRSNQMPPDQKNLPRHLDSEKGWRHPVFGDRDTWVHQKGGPWFGKTIKRKAPAFRKAVLDAMEQIKNEIES